MSSRQLPGIVVIGSAVQDITVELDMDRLRNQCLRNRTEELGKLIELSQDGIKFSPRLVLVTRLANKRFAVKLEFDDTNNSSTDANGLVTLAKDKDKFTLKGVVTELAREENPPEPFLFVPCEMISWGGGGINLTTFLRALVSDKEALSITYVDVAMRRTLPEVLRQFESLREQALSTGEQNERVESPEEIREIVDIMLDRSPVNANYLTQSIAELAADYAPEHSLGVCPGTWLVD